MSLFFSNGMGHYRVGSRGDTGVPREGTREIFELLISVFSTGGGRLVEFLGVPRVDWARLGSSCRRLRTHVVVALANSVRDTGREGGFPADPGFQAEFRVGQVGTGFQWIPVAVQNQSLQAIFQPAGDEDSERASPRLFQARGSSSSGGPTAMVQPSADSPGQPSADSTVQLNADSTGQPSADSTVQQRADSVGQGSGERFDEGSSEVFRLGSSRAEGPQQGVGRSSRVVPSPSVQIGGSSSSTAPYVPILPTLELDEPTGTSSGSHGFNSHWDLAVTYEDCFQSGDDLEGFPYVGTWVRVHFLVRLFSAAGLLILRFLGRGADGWWQLRTTSNYQRYALAQSVYEALKVGPRALEFECPQWFELVDRWVAEGGGFDEGGDEDSRFQHFPYVVWAPPHTTHYLWKLFLLQGYQILSFLGTRVREWAYLRSTAQGFRSHVVMALILWLRATGPQRMADGVVSFHAAEVYLNTGQRQFPFAVDDSDDEELDARPHRAAVEPIPAPVRRVFAADSSSSDSSEDSEQTSTAEPSSSEVGLLPGNVSGELELPEASSQTVARYAAFPGILRVFYVDDYFDVPLQGWTEADIGAIIAGLESGDWTNWEQALEARGSISDVANQEPSQDSAFRSVAGRSGRLAWAAASSLAEEFLAGWVRVILFVFMTVQAARGERVF